MCVSRLQRIMTAIVLGLVLYFFTSGNITIAAILQVFVIIMMLIWAVTNFCPSTWILKKIFPPCSWDK